MAHYKNKFTPMILARSHWAFLIYFSVNMSENLEQKFYLKEIHHTEENQQSLHFS